MFSLRDMEFEFIRMLAAGKMFGCKSREYAEACQSWRVMVSLCPVSKQQFDEALNRIAYEWGG